MFVNEFDAPFFETKLFKKQIQQISQQEQQDSDIESDYDSDQEENLILLEMKRKLKESKKETTLKQTDITTKIEQETITTCLKHFVRDFSTSKKESKSDGSLLNALKYHDPKVFNVKVYNKNKNIYETYSRAFQKKNQPVVISHEQFKKDVAGLLQRKKDFTSISLDLKLKGKKNIDKKEVEIASEKLIDVNKLLEIYENAVLYREKVYLCPNYAYIVKSNYTMHPVTQYEYNELKKKSNPNIDLFERKDIDKNLIFIYEKEKAQIDEVDENNVPIKPPFCVSTKPDSLPPEFQKLSIKPDSIGEIIKKKVSTSVSDSPNYVIGTNDNPNFNAKQDQLSMLPTILDSLFNKNKCQDKNVTSQCYYMVGVGPSSVNLTFVQCLANIFNTTVEIILGNIIEYISDEKNLFIEDYKNINNGQLAYSFSDPKKVYTSVNDMIEDSLNNFSDFLINENVVINEDILWHLVSKYPQVISNKIKPFNLFIFEVILKSQDALQPTDEEEDIPVDTGKYTIQLKCPNNYKSFYNTKNELSYCIIKYGNKYLSIYQRPSGFIKSFKQDNPIIKQLFNILETCDKPISLESTIQFDDYIFNISKNKLNEIKEYMKNNNVLFTQPLSCDEFIKSTKSNNKLTVNHRYININLQTSFLNLTFKSKKVFYPVDTEYSLLDLPFEYINPNTNLINNFEILVDFLNIINTLVIPIALFKYADFYYGILLNNKLILYFEKTSFDIINNTSTLSKLPVIESDIHYYNVNNTIFYNKPQYIQPEYNDAQINKMIQQINHESIENELYQQFRYEFSHYIQKIYNNINYKETINKQLENVYSNKNVENSLKPIINELYDILVKITDIDFINTDKLDKNNIRYSCFTRDTCQNDDYCTFNESQKRCQLKINEFRFDGTSVKKYYVERIIEELVNIPSKRIELLNNLVENLKDYTKLTLFDGDIEAYPEESELIAVDQEIQTVNYTFIRASSKALKSSSIKIDQTKRVAEDGISLDDVKKRLIILNENLNLIKQQISNMYETTEEQKNLEPNRSPELEQEPEGASEPEPKPSKFLSGRISIHEFIGDLADIAYWNMND